MSSQRRDEEFSDGFEGSLVASPSFEMLVSDPARGEDTDAVLFGAVAGECVPTTFQRHTDEFLGPQEDFCTGFVPQEPPGESLDLPASGQGVFAPPLGVVTSGVAAVFPVLDRLLSPRVVVEVSNPAGKCVEQQALLDSCSTINCVSPQLLAAWEGHGVPVLTRKAQEWHGCAAGPQNGFRVDRIVEVYITLRVPALSGNTSVDAC